jgi:hypothetical protein
MMKTAGLLCRLIVIRAFVVGARISNSCCPHHRCREWTNTDAVVGTLSPVSAPNVPSYEIDILYDLYNATNGMGWLWGMQPGMRWNFTEDANPCADEWQGLTCILFCRMMITFT